MIGRWIGCVLPFTLLLSACGDQGGASEQELGGDDAALGEASAALAPNVGLALAPNAALTLAPIPAVRNHIIDDVLVRPIFRQTIPLSQKAGNHEISTADLQGLGNAGPDTVMIVQGPGQQWTNDDCPGTGTLASCVSIPGSLTSVTVTVFAYAPQAFGTFDLIVNNVQRFADAQFGGSKLRLNVPIDGGPYVMQTVTQPGGASDTTLFLLRSNFAYGTMNTDGGMGLAAKISAVPAAGDYLLVGSPSLANLGSTSTTRVVINPCLDDDVSCTITAARASGGDNDEDRLTNKMEEELGTDPNQKDSDGDGIFDYDEVIGRRLGSAELELPSMGSNPRRADLFIELDRVKAQPATVNDAVMQPLKQIFLDLPKWRNPDGSTGIAVHADIGAACSDLVLCGNWGGSEIYPEPVSPDTAQAECNRFPSDEVVKQHLAPVRRGIFHYTLRTCGAQGRVLGVQSRIGPNNNETEAELWAQQLANNLGLSAEHSGDVADPVESRVTFKVNYPSVGNSTYQNRIPGRSELARFSEGRLAELFNLGTLEHGYSPGVPKQHFEKAPFSFDMVDDDVDFNRDGRLSNEPVSFDYSPINAPSAGATPYAFRSRDVAGGTPTGGGAVVFLPEALDPFQIEPFVVAPLPLAAGGSVPAVTTTLPWDFADFDPSWTYSPQPSETKQFDENGEVGAAYREYLGKRALLVTAPLQDGRLIYTHYHPSTKVWWAWSYIPEFPPGARARQATVTNLNGEVYLVFRDMNAPDDQPNVWLNRAAPGGVIWQGWELLNLSSYLTPGIALGSDGQVYLLYAPSSTDGSGNLHVDLALARRPLTGGDFTRVEQLQFPPNQFGSGPIPTKQRTRLQLLFLPYLGQGAQPFADGSGYLAAFWNSGSPSSQDSWLFKRAYTPGYISPAGSCFGASIKGGDCNANRTLVTHFSQNTDRPMWGTSPGVARRGNVAGATYVQSNWDPAHVSTVQAREPRYVPHASGIAPPFPDDLVLLPNAASRCTDNDDALMFRKNMCQSLHSLEGDGWRCPPVTDFPPAPCGPACN